MLSYLQTKQTLKFSHCRQMLAPLEVSKPKQDSRKHQVRTSAQRVKNMFINSNYLGKKETSWKVWENICDDWAMLFRGNLLSCGNSHLKKKLEYSRFTVVLVSAVQVSDSAVCVHRSPPSQPALCPSPPQVTTELRAELPARHGKFPLAAWQCTCVNPSLPIHPTLHCHLFSTFVCLFLPCK